MNKGRVAVAVAVAIVLGGVVFFVARALTEITHGESEALSSKAVEQPKPQILPVERSWRLIGQEELAPLASKAGKPVRLSERTEPVLVVVVWASWCEYCKEMLDVLSKTVTANSEDRFRVVTLNVDEKLQDAEGALRTQEWAGLLESYFDSGGKIREWASHGKIPLTLIFDRERRVKGVFRGGGEKRAGVILAKAQKEAGLL